MLYGLNSSQDNNENKFHQRVADQNIQSLEQRQEEIQHAKNGFIGMLAGILVGGVVGWLFLGPAENLNKEKVIPTIHRPLTVAKVQPNDPGGMEIENQNREIYHIVDNTPKPISEVNIIEAPDMPKLIVEKDIETPDNIENLVESLENDNSLVEAENNLDIQMEKNVKIADLSAIRTTGRDKVIIPTKIKDVEVKLQDSINSEKNNTVAKTVSQASEHKEIKSEVQTVNKSVKSAKGTWYAQLIASSSRKTVENLWKNLASKHTFLKNYSYEIEEITAANGNTLYRLKVGAFKTRKEAETLSNKLKQNKISSIIKQN
ncbi:MAG: SPOR domain-containing protein [Acetobacter sp.]|nr:SPOR domain-containing protein [Acetobacter sp.]